MPGAAGSCVDGVAAGTAAAVAGLRAVLSQGHLQLQAPPRLSAGGVCGGAAGHPATYVRAVLSGGGLSEPGRRGVRRGRAAGARVAVAASAFLRRRLLGRREQFCETLA